MTCISIKNKNEYNFNDIFGLIFKKNRNKNISTYGLITQDISLENYRENDTSIIVFDNFRDLVLYMKDIMDNIIIDRITFANSYDNFLLDDIFLLCQYSQKYTTLYKIIGISKEEFDVLVKLKT